MSKQFAGTELTMASGWPPYTSTKAICHDLCQERAVYLAPPLSQFSMDPPLPRPWNPLPPKNHDSPWNCAAPASAALAYISFLIFLCLIRLLRAS